MFFDRSNEIGDFFHRFSFCMIMPRRYLPILCKLIQTPQKTQNTVLYLNKAVLMLWLVRPGELLCALSRRTELQYFGEEHMFRILIIEDGTDIQKVLKNYLTAEGYEVISAGDGIDGIAKFHEGHADLILLDVMLPKVDGFTVLELIRKESKVPVIMVTARDSVEDQVHGFRLMVDDYIPKPFDMPVLLCKIAAVLRRSGAIEAENRLYYRDLVLDEEGRQVYLKGQEVEMTQKEFDLLRVFMGNKGKVFTRQSLLDRVWGIDYFGDERIVDTHIKNLRKKLNVDYIQTVRGVGYRIEKAVKR